MNLDKRLLSIGQAALYLGVTEATLRRWHEDGSFPATFVSPGKHRYYAVADLEKRTKGLFQLALEWASAEQGGIPSSDFYCSTADRFKTRNERMTHELERGSLSRDVGALVSSASGEIGNNSFDHNLGNWPDTPGVFYVYDAGKRIIVLADRGVGVLATLKRVRPVLASHTDALRMAFTEYVTGRAPEHRGNGLKYVRDAVRLADARLRYQSGDAVLDLKPGQDDIRITQADVSIRGCLALISF